MIGKEVRNCDYCLKGWNTYPCSSSIHDSSIKWSNESNNSSKSGNKGKGNPRMQTLVELDSLTEIWQFLPLLESRIFFGCVIFDGGFSRTLLLLPPNIIGYGERSGPLYDTRPVPFHDFTLFVILSLFTGGSPNEGRKYSPCGGWTGREKREDNK